MKIEKGLIILIRPTNSLEKHYHFVLSDMGSDGRVLLVNATTEFNNPTSNLIYTKSDHPIFSNPSILKYELARAADVGKLTIYLNNQDNYYGHLKNETLKKMINEAKVSDALAKKYLSYLN